MVKNKQTVTQTHNSYGEMTKNTRYYELYSGE